MLKAKIRTITSLVILVCANFVHAENAEPNRDDFIDLATVREKINALGLRDDTLESCEQPLQWLKQRREKILPQLIAGLDNSEFRVASGCLKVLDGVAENGDLLNALLCITANKTHPINVEATLSLCSFAQDSQAKKILEEALIDTVQFSDPKNRATIAEALDRKAEAVDLLIPFLDSQTEEYELRDTIKWLGDIGHKSAIEPLEKMSLDSRWLVATESCLAIAKIDPNEHGLTQDQETFLTKSSQQFKENRSTRIARWKKLADLNKEEIRPFVMQMIASDQPEAGLIVLQVWKDRQALPEIHRLMKEKWRCLAFMVAYLDIEGTDESIAEVISMTAKPGSHYGMMPGLPGAMPKRADPDGMPSGMMPGASSPVRDFSAEYAVRAITQSIMSDERKLAVLRRFRDELGHQVVAKNLYYWGEEGTAEILSSLMTEETDISALGEYAKQAANYGESRFDEKVFAALKKLISKDTISSNEVYGAQSILDSCAACKLDNSGKLTDKFLSSDSAVSIRIAAARVSATLGGNRNEALKILHEKLGDSNTVVRKQVSECLASIECLNSTEQIEREEIILSHLGKPTEDYALRVLATCAGDKTAKQLSPILDEENIPRAVYTAWVLAQHPDKTVKHKALRRVAIYAMFNHQIYQVGAGINFTIAPDLPFSQFTGHLVGYLKGRGGQGAEQVHIPDDLIVPFEFDVHEQDFAIGVYRHTRWERLSGFHLLDGPGFSWGQSHLPLLRVIVREDPYLDILHVKGSKVAHFRYRKVAAEIITGITNAKASYIGLACEEIDSEQVPPQPYNNQNTLIAQHVLDQIATVGIPRQSQDNIQNNRREAIGQMIENLINELGDELKKELIAESNRRNITLELKNAGFSIWQNMAITE